jgi:hypothetical protein
MRVAETEPLAAALAVAETDWTRLAVTVVEDVADESTAASFTICADADAEDVALTATTISLGSMP